MNARTARSVVRDWASKYASWSSAILGSHIGESRRASRVIG